MSYTNPRLIWSPSELNERGNKRENDPRLVILDMRPPEAYANGHIPGARSFDIFGVSLVDTRPQPLEAFLWLIEHLIQQKGITNDSTIVAYDDIAGMRSARIFWFMEYFGHEDTHVLNGGFHAWTAAGFPATQESQIPKPGSFQSNRRRERLATADDVFKRLHQPSTAIVDARTDGEYTGQTVRASRGGAIPGAIHIEWTNNLNPEGFFKSAKELKTLYQGRNAGPDREVIPYCHGGYRSAHVYLALRLLGYPRVRNYLGSWGEWGNRMDLPVEIAGR